MNASLKLMAIFAHPDDESLGVGGTIARYVAEGVEVHLVTATRGERGWFGDEASNPGLEALGRIREKELLAAAKVLGISSVSFLDYIDGDLDQAPPQEAIGRIVSHVRRVRPDVVLTFGSDGAYGHPDHIAISQFTSAALLRACDGSFTDAEGLEPHAVSKLYHMCNTTEEFRLYESIFGDLVMHIDGVARRSSPVPDWYITTKIDTSAYWTVVRSAVACHRSQLPGYESLLNLPDQTLSTLWSHENYYRAFSTVNGGRRLETDLFEGIREA
ncbi:MAG: PIG-L deacetylase family protein [Chloroflexota bacterium]